MNFFKNFLIILFLLLFCKATFADNHDINTTTENIAEVEFEEEDVPLNDPFAGDESLSSGTNLVSGSEEEREAMSLYKFKLVGIILGEYDSYVTLVDASGETLSLTLHEELSTGVKLVDLKVNEAIFEKDDNTYLSINFKNQIKEMNEY